MTPFKDYPDTPEPWQSEDEFHGGPCRMSWLTTPLMLIAGLVLILFLAVSGAWAHTAPTGWQYPTSCCWAPAQGRVGDCAEIPTDSVKEGPNGYQVTLSPGDHPMVTADVSFIVAYADAQTSPDGLYHVCFRQDMSARCFFAGARGS